MALTLKWILAIVIMVLMVICAEWLEHNINKSSNKNSYEIKK